jgi:hypothetical protein
MTMDKSEILLMAEKRTALTDEYMKLTKELIDIKKKRALNWATFRSVVTSDTQAERDWQATPLGQKEIELTYVLKAMEKGLSAMKLEIDCLRDESRNQY